MGLFGWLFGDVGMDSANHIVQSMHSVKEEVIREMVHAAHHVTNALEQNAKLSQISLHASTASIPQDKMAAGIGRLSNVKLMRSLVIAGAIGAVTVLYWYINRSNPDTNTMHFQSTIEVEEADGARSKSHRVMRGSAAAMREYLRPWMPWAQSEAPVQPSVRQQVRVVTEIDEDGSDFE